MLKTVITALLFLALAGCGSPHSIWTFNSYQVTPEPNSTGQTYHAHRNKVWVTKDDLPRYVRYQVIEEIDIGSKWYGSTAKLNKHFAKLGRKAGADAVIKVETWHQPHGFSWAAPQGRGIAIKIIQPADFDFTALSGDFY